MKAYLTIKEIVESGEYPFTMGQMRFFLSRRHKNNLSIAVRKISKKIYLKKQLWDSWIESQAEKGGTK